MLSGGDIINVQSVWREKIMAINVRKALAIIQKDLAKTWKKLDFDYEIVDNDEIKVKSSVTLTNVDDDILIIINCFNLIFNTSC